MKREGKKKKEKKEKRTRDPFLESDDLVTL